jgi:hypothetical protein
MADEATPFCSGPTCVCCGICSVCPHVDGGPSHLDVCACAPGGQHWVCFDCEAFDCAHKPGVRAR